MARRHYFTESLADILEQGAHWIGLGYWREGLRGERLRRALRESFPVAFGQSISALVTRVKEMVAAGTRLERGPAGTVLTLGELPRIGVATGDIVYRVLVRYRSSMTGEIRERPVIVSDLGLVTRPELIEAALQVGVPLIQRYRERGLSVTGVSSLVESVTIEAAFRR